MPSHEGEETGYTSGTGSDGSLRGLEHELHQQYVASPASHETHAHFSRIGTELEVDSPVMPGFEPLSDRKEFGEFVAAAETLAHRYSELIQKYGSDHGAIVSSPEWTVTFKEVERFDASLAGLQWNSMTARDTESVLKAVLTMQGHADDFATDSRGIHIEGEPSVNRLIQSNYISDERLQELYWLPPENPGRHHSGRSFFANFTASDFADTQTRVYAVTRAYRGKQAIDFIEPGTDPTADLLLRETSWKSLATYELKHAEPFEYTPEEIAAHDSRMRQRIKKLLTEGSGLSEPAAQRYMYALLNRSLVSRDAKNPEEPLYISGDRIDSDLAQTSRLARSVQPPLLNYLSEEAGVVNFDRYGEKMLHDLTDLFHTDERAEEGRERMRKTGVTVVFVTAYADHNDAFGEIGSMYSHKNETTLLFEVSRRSDFYRRMLLLKKHGIKATTIVIAAHGDPGKTAFSDGGGLFDLVVGEGREGTSDASLDRANLARLVGDEFMTNDEHGERRIIVHSCSSAVRPEGQASIAEAITERAKHLNLRVIGAADVMGAHRNEEDKIHFGDFSEIESRTVPVGREKSVGVEFSLASIEERATMKERIRQRLGIRAASTPTTPVIRARAIDAFDPIRRINPQERNDS